MLNLPHFFYASPHYYRNNLAWKLRGLAETKLFYKGIFKRLTLINELRQNNRTNAVVATSVARGFPSRTSVLYVALVFKIESLQMKVVCPKEISKRLTLGSGFCKMSIDEFHTEARTWRSAIIAAM